MASGVVYCFGLLGSVLAPYLIEIGYDMEIEPIAFMGYCGTKKI